MNRKASGWVTAIIGVLFLLVGLIWGLVGSHQVGYENSQQGVAYEVGTGRDSGNVYINAPGSSEYFVAFKSDFSPALSLDNVDSSATVNFIARTDTSSISLRVNGTDVTEAHKIEKLYFTDKSGSVVATFTDSEYLSNPNGVYVSVWSDAIWLVLLGLLCIAGGAFNIVRKQNTSFRIGNGPVPGYPPAAPTYPPAQPGYPPTAPSYPPAQPADPYAQPYQGVNPYAQQGGNPYQQPPQG